MNCMFTVPPLGSTVVTRFPTTTGESDSRSGSLTALCIRLRRWSTGKLTLYTVLRVRLQGLLPAAVHVSTTPAGLPGSSTFLSVRAIRHHPGSSCVCICSLLPHRFQTSPPPAGWSRPLSCNEAIRFTCVTAHTFAPCLPLGDSFPGFTIESCLSQCRCATHRTSNLCGWDLSPSKKGQALPGAPKGTKKSLTRKSLAHGKYGRTRKRTNRRTGEEP